MSEPEWQTERAMGVKKCARCGGEHPTLVFNRLTNPPRLIHPDGQREVELAWWAMCPEADEPIWMAENVPVVPGSDEPRAERIGG